jgi:hypothetical protein
MATADANQHVTQDDAVLLYQQQVTGLVKDILVRCCELDLHQLLQKDGEVWVPRPFRVPAAANDFRGTLRMVAFIKSFHPAVSLDSRPLSFRVDWAHLDVLVGRLGPEGAAQKNLVALQDDLQTGGIEFLALFLLTKIAPEVFAADRFFREYMVKVLADDVLDKVEPSQGGDAHTRDS